MKLKCKLEPREGAEEKYIWEIRALQLEDPDKWVGRTYYYCHPPYYKMKAVTKGTKKIIHFSFNDETCPSELKSSPNKGVCHQIVQDCIQSQKRLNVQYMRRYYELLFSEIEQEYLINKDDISIRPDLYGTISGPQTFIDAMGTDKLAIEVYFGNSKGLKNISIYRKLNVAAIQIDMRESNSYKKESMFFDLNADEKKHFINTLKKYTRTWRYKFTILHFPSHRDKRNFESKPTKRAKNTHRQQVAAAAQRNTQTNLQTARPAVKPAESSTHTNPSNALRIKRNFIQKLLSLFSIK